MSKSSQDIQSRILLTDTYQQIKSKIRGAVTDSLGEITYDPIKRPGTANLLTILAACTGGEAAEVVKQYAGKGHSHLKADVTEAVEELLKGPRAELEKLRAEKSYLSRIAAEGGERARARSDIVMRGVRNRIGLS
jgi:tryptophanyl-tRNA synthetase